MGFRDKAQRLSSPTGPVDLRPESPAVPWDAGCGGVQTQELWASASSRDQRAPHAPVDGGTLFLTRDGVAGLQLTRNRQAQFVRRIRGEARYRPWIEGEDLEDALAIPENSRPR